MSRRNEVSITCPQCKREHPFLIWESVNTKLNPELKEAILDGSMFIFECPTCGATTNVDYDFLYHEMEDQIMLQYVSSEEHAQEAFEMWTNDEPENPGRVFREDGYIIRIVRTRNELLEKIAIFDEDLDDRIIELYKIFVLASVLEEHPEHKEIKVLYYKDQGKNCLKLIANGEAIGYAEIVDSTYEKLISTFINKMPDIRSDGPCINRAWAMDMMGVEISENES